MRTLSVGTVLSVLALLAAVAGCGPAAADRVEVWFISPLEGDEVEGPDVLVRLGASGVEIVSADIHEAGTGHHHIFVNTDLTPLSDTIPSGVTGILHLGQGQTEFLVRGLEPGEHQLITVIADHAHIPLDPPAVDTVRFTVVEARGTDGS
jgi:hypothetical protein